MDVFDDGHDHFFHQGHDVVLFDEAHFEIDLGEFGLAVGAEVLIAEAASDLEVAFDAADHENLLVLLGRLRQGVEGAWADAAGHEVVAGAFGRAFAEDGRFDFHETIGVKHVAADLGDAVAEAEIGDDAGAAHVEVAVLEF